MDDTTKIKKIPQKKRLKTTIAMRAFFVSIIILVIPLLFHEVITYKRDFNDKIRDLFVGLNILSNSHKDLIQEEIDFYEAILEIIEEDVDFTEAKNNVNQYLKRVSDISKTEGLFYLEGESLECLFSSNDTLIGKKFFDLKLDLNEKGKAYFILNKQEYLPSETLFIADPVVQKGKMGYLVIGVPLFSFIKKLVLDEQKKYAIDVTLFDKNGEVNYSTNKNFPAKVSLNRDENFENAYWLEIDNERKIAIKLNFQDKFFLLFDISEKDVLGGYKKNYIFEIVRLFFLVLIIGGGLSIWVINLLSKPLFNLINVMLRIRDNDLDARYKKKFFGFEINYLGQYLNEMIESLLFHQKRAEEEKLHKLKIQQELKLGREIQLSMFPLKFDIPQLEISSGHLSAKEVSGDFYDLLPHEDERNIFLAIADASGKGIPACLNSLHVRGSLRSFFSDNIDLEKIVVKTNNLFLKDTETTSMFVTAWLGVFDKKKKILCYTSCGHPGALLFRKGGEYLELSTSGMALGVELFDKLEMRTITLKEGDFLFMYTDGALEAENRNKEHYGKERILKTITGCLENRPAQILEELLTDIRKFTESKELFDDITFLGIKIS